MRKRAGAKEKFLYGMRNVQKTLDEFEENQRADADNLLYIYKYNKQDMPLDVYRSVAFFMNREYKNKSGSLYLLYQANERLRKEMPKATKENIVEHIAYRFKVYTQVLEEAGYWKQ
jgi:hypothetical protein